ncbi:MAG: hypothetical protein ACFE8J_17540 [Candidatus Heimdallarchaeota archaeon]
MGNTSKSININKIKAEYNKKLKDMERKLAIKHKELNKIEDLIAHERIKKVVHSDISDLKSSRVKLNYEIHQLEKEIKRINKEKIKRLRKL